MNLPDHVFALFIEANPVADPEVLRGAEDGSPKPLRLVEAEPTARARPAKVNAGLPPRFGWKPAAVAAAAVLLMGVIGVGAFRYATTLGGPVAAEAAQMHVVFDGASCVYSGPTELLAGDGVVEFEQVPGTEPVLFLVSQLRSDYPDVDRAEIEEWAATHSAISIPPWLGFSEVGALEDGATSSQMPVTFYERRYVVTCHTSPEGTDRVYVGAVLTATSG